MTIPHFDMTKPFGVYFEGRMITAARYRIICESPLGNALYGLTRPVSISPHLPYLISGKVKP